MCKCFKLTCCIPCILNDIIIKITYIKKNLNLLFEEYKRKSEKNIDDSFDNDLKQALLLS
jgi:hypothetical protein